MSDQAKLKEGLKKTIRALVMSAPMGLTVEEVERDHAKFEGCPVPYRQLGYNTCRDFLQDIPDTVRSVWERGHLVVRSVADESTRHIQSLVDRQKVDVQNCLKKRRATARAHARPHAVTVPVSSSSSRPASWRPGGRSYPVGQSRTTPSHSQGVGYNSRPRPRGPPPVQSSVPAYVRSQIKSLLITYPNGVQNSHFDMLFAEKFGHTICCNKLGFETLRHMCQALSEFVSIEKLAEGEFRIYERSNYPGGENPTPERTSEFNRAEHLSKVPVDSTLSAKRQAESFRQDASSDHGPSQQITPKWQDSNTTFHVSLGKPAGQTRAQPEHRETVYTREGTLGSSAAPTGSADDVNAPTRTNGITSDLFETTFLEEIQQVLAEHPDGVWAAYLPDVYKDKFNKALPMMSLGYYSVTELMAAMPEVVVIEREQKQSDWKLYDIRTYKEKSTNSTNSVKEETNSNTNTENSKIPKKVSADPSKGFLELKTKIRQVLEQNPEGVFLKSLPLTYKKTFDEPFPLEELGFRDVDSLVMMMPDTVGVVYKGYGRLLLVLVDKSTTIPRHKSIPDDAVGWGFSYFYPDNPPIQEYIEIYVATVFTPHRMCIQLKHKESNDELDELMDNLESIYAYPEGNKYEFPESMVAIGQVCCVLYLSDNNWHRGIITGIPKVDFVEVLYVDYGTVATVSRSSLRLLKSKFLRLPVQAFSARLAYIEPIEEKWTKDAKERLLALTAGKPLIALITEIQKGELYMLLSDTTTQEDVHINDALVEEGLAQFAGALSEQDEPIAPQLRPYQFSEDEISESELELLTLNDLVTETGEASQVDDDYCHVEPPVTHPGQENTVTSKEIEGAVNIQVQSSPPGLPVPAQESQEASQTMLNNCLTSQETDNGLKSSFDSEASRNSMPRLEESPEDGPWVVKRIDLDDGSQVHLINHDNEACLTVAEVAAMLCDEDSDPEDVLCQLVSELGIEVPLLTAIENDHPRLFRELRRMELLDSSDSSPELLTMMPFTSALLLLSSSGTVGMDAVQQLQEIVEDLGVVGDMFGSEVSDGAMDDLALSLELAELHITLETLQFKRKRILSAMMHNTEVNYVDNLSNIETKMQEIRKIAEAIEVIIRERAVEADKMALKMGSNSDATFSKDETRQVNSLTNASESNYLLPGDGKVAASSKPSPSVSVSGDGCVKSPDRLVQAVEPLPREEEPSDVAQGKSPPNSQQPEHAGYARSLSQRQQPPAVDQSQHQYQPPANPNAQFTQPSVQNAHFAQFPNPRFLPQANQCFPPLHAQYPAMSGGSLGYQHHGAGDFVPPMYTNQPHWLGPALQGPIMNQFPPHLGPMLHGLPPRPFMVNPQGYYPNSGGPPMTGQAPRSQGPWW